MERLASRRLIHLDFHREYRTGAPPIGAKFVEVNASHRETHSWFTANTVIIGNEKMRLTMRRIFNKKDKERHSAVVNEMRLTVRHILKPIIMDK